VHRLLKKFATAADLVPQPVLRRREEDAAWACCTSAARRRRWTRRWIRWPPRASTSTRCGCGPSRSRQVREFIANHDHVFVVEQNRDAQMRTLLINELEIDPAWLISVLHYDGTPITARFISRPSPSMCMRWPCTPRRAAGAASAGDP
jgi:2-oxoglutarate ferredoxin oxidoreductase subunit alpha